MTQEYKIVDCLSYEAATLLAKTEREDFGRFTIRYWDNEAGTWRVYISWT